MRDAIRAGGRLVAALLLAGFAAGARAQPADIPGELRVHVSPITGHANFVSLKPEARAAQGLRRAPAVQAADIVARYGPLFGVADPARQLRETASVRDALGYRHTVYAQVHGGVPVFSGMLKVHLDGFGGFVAANGNVYPIPAVLDTVPNLGAEAAKQIARAAVEGGAPAAEAAELVIVDPGWYGDPAVGPHLAWYVEVADAGAQTREGFFVDAHSGKVLDRWNLIENVLNREFHDTTPAPGRTAVLTERSSLAAVAAADAEVRNAFTFAGDFHGYFSRGFGRDSFDGRGGRLLASLQVMAGFCPNAFFTTQGFGLGPHAVFCTGFSSDDFVGHEFTHGVTAFSANLIYQNQPGQMNESFSDVFGELIDLFNGNAAFAGARDIPPLWPNPPRTVLPRPTGTDDDNRMRAVPPAAEACSPFPGFANGVRWIIGEDVLFPTQRDMWNPPCFDRPADPRIRYPDSTTHPSYGCPAFDNGGVHFGSSVPNHAFAMLTDGKVFGGQAVVGIGPIKAGAVWYRALTVYLTPASNFQDAYLAFNQAASDLIGMRPRDPRTGLPGAMFTAADAQQVDRALLAVGMNRPVGCNLASRSYVFLVDTTGSAAGANVYYNGVIDFLARFLDTRPGSPAQFALARFDDYPCLPFGDPATDVPYRLITPFVTANDLRRFLPVSREPANGADTPESQIDAIVTALTGRALVPQAAGCGPGVPAGQGAFPASAERSPTTVFLLTTPRLFHLPAPGKPHVYTVSDITSLVTVITQAAEDEPVLNSLVTISFDEPEPPLAPDTVDFKSVLTAIKQVGGTGANFRGTTGGEACVAKRACVFAGGGSACLEAGDVDSDGDGLADACAPLFPACDLNQDSDIDRADIDVIFSSRNVPAPLGDPRDVDGDGTITVNDARVCTLKCTKPNCAP